jgi:NADPH:quinone reductase-like Zn-dependent oxidoreductase
MRELDDAVNPDRVTSPSGVRRCLTPSTALCRGSLKISQQWLAGARTYGMKAIVQDRYGAPEVLELRQVDKPVAGPHDLLVRVHAASINARDWHIMRGDPYVMRVMSPSLFGLNGPKMKIRGCDFGGRVESVGGAVTRFAPGDEVYGDVGNPDGALAEYVVLPEDLAEQKPVNVSFEQAAAVPLAGNTALTGLGDAARLQTGQHVLINGASGGVGTFAVQIATAFGAEVTGVCSTRNVDLVRSIGADHVIDYTCEDFARGSARYDVLFDLVGNRSLADCRRVLKPNGTLVLSGGGTSRGGSLFGPMGPMVRAMVVSKFVRDHRLVILMVAPNRANLATLRELIESGQVTPIIDRAFPLDKTPDAIRYMEGEHARAKIAISVYGSAA